MRLFFILVIFSLYIGSTDLFSQDLDSLQWKNRVILLKDSSIESDWLKAQLKRLKSNHQELLDREVVILLLTDKIVFDETKRQAKINAANLIQKYQLQDFIGLVLIGKDGGEKLKEEFIVSPSKIIDLIDSMPMRITELKNRG